jgi:DNA repair protein RecN (Recombination protein N)
VVSKAARGGATESDVQRVSGEARVAEVARMLGARATGTSLAHAQEMLAAAEEAPARKAQRSRA